MAGVTLTATAAQLEALDAWIAIGSGKGAAWQLGISHHSWRRRMANLRTANGALHNGQLAWQRGRDIGTKAA